MSHDCTLWFFDGSPQLPLPSASSPGARGETPLHDAAGFGHAAVVELLISAGATVDAANRYGRGPGRVFQVAFRSGADEVTGRGLYIGR